MFSIFGKVLVSLLVMALFAFQPFSARAASDFDLPAAHGGRLKLSQLQGRVVVLDFFATWCRPCRATIPKLNKIYSRYRDRGVTVLGFSLDKEGRDKVRRYVATQGVDFPVVIGNNRLASQLGQVEVLPTTIVLDPRGRQVARFEGVVDESRIIAAFKPHLSRNAPLEPTVLLKAKRRRPSQNRFYNVSVDQNQLFHGQRGLMINVMVDLADLTPEQGLWLVLHIRKEKKAGSGLVPVGKDKSFYLRVDKAGRRRFGMFVRCDQFPPTPPDHLFRSWVTIMDASHRQQGRSGDFIISSPPCLTAKSN